MHVISCWRRASPPSLQYPVLLYSAMQAKGLISYIEPRGLAKRVLLPRQRHCSRTVLLPSSTLLPYPSIAVVFGVYLE